MEKKMFALTYCYEGTDNTHPYGITIAVSTDIEKLKNEMIKCVDEDCQIDNDDEWSTEKNFTIYNKYDIEITLQHRKNINLYATYKIHSVNCL